MPDRGCVTVRQCRLLVLVASAILALAGCRSGLPSPTLGPGAGPSPTPVGAQIPTLTPLVMRTSVPTTALSATPAIGPEPSETLLPAVTVSASATPSSLTPAVVDPTPTRVQPGSYVISDVLLFDGAHDRVYARGRAEEQNGTLVLSATDGNLLAAYDYAGALGLDAEHRWLYVDGAGLEVVILDADTGERLAAVAVPAQEGYQPRAIPPQTDPARGQVLAFRQNVVYVAEGASGRVAQTISFDFEKSKDCRTGEGAYPIEWAAFDPSARILYVSYLSYVCTPWFGFGIVSYDLASGRQIVQSGEYAFDATADGGYLYGSSWHRFGIGYIWAWRDGRPWRRSSEWNSRPRFAVDRARQRLYGDIGGSLGVLDAQTMDLLFVAPYPGAGQTVGFDAVADRLYFLLDGRLRAVAAGEVKAPMAQNLAPTVAPTVPVDLLIVSPSWPDDRTVIGIWGRAQAMDRCYAFAQQGGTLLLSGDGGQSWALPGAGLPECRQVASLAVSPDFARDQTLLTGLVGLGIFRSTDGGRLWKPASVGLASMSVQELILSPGFASDQLAFVRVATGGPYRSSDGGHTWQELDLPGDLPAEQLLLSPGFARDRTVFARSGSGELYRSRDAGSTWQGLSMALRPMALSPEFDRDGTILGSVPDTSDLYISRDSGTHWEKPGKTPANAPIRWLSLAPLFAKWGVAFAQARDPSPGLGQVAGAVLYRTGDSGLSWQEVLLESGEPLAVPPDASMAFVYAPDVEENRPLYLLWTQEDFATTPPAKRGCLFRSGDGGITWREARLPGGLIPTAITVSPHFASDRLVFLGAADGRVLALRDDMLY